MSYIKKHWNGELPLTVAFFVNGMLLNILIFVFMTYLETLGEIMHPQDFSRLYLFTTFVATIIIFPWQIVGMWSTAARYVFEKKLVFVSRLVQLLVILGVFGTFGALNQSMDLYKGIYKIAFNVGEYKKYDVTYHSDQQQITVKGDFGFGVAEDTEVLLKRYDNIKTLVLNSRGGRVYEGQAMAKLVLAYQLNTLTVGHCVSACTTAFIAGRVRHIDSAAMLGFHRYSNELEKYTGKEETEKVQKSDLVFFKHQGVKQYFLDMMYIGDTKDIWYPSHDELLDAGVIHGVRLAQQKKKKVAANKAAVIKPKHEPTTNKHTQKILTFDDIPELIRVGEKTIGIVPPDGYQEMGSKIESVKKLGESITPSINRLLGFYFSAKDVKILEEGKKEPDMDRYMLLQIHKTYEKENIPLITFQQEIIKGMRNQNALAGKKMKSMMDQQMDRMSENFSKDYSLNLSMKVGVPRPMGVMYEFPEAIGQASIIRYEVMIDGVKEPYLMAVGTNIMLKDGKMLYLYVYSNYSSMADLEWVRTTSIGWVESNTPSRTARN